MFRLGRAAAWIRSLSAERLLGPHGHLPRRPASAGRKHEILLRVHGEGESGIAEILMNRPHAKNSLGKVLVDELYETLDVLHFDDSVRVVIIRSNVEGVFCAGADLKERAAMTDTETDLFVQKLRSLMDGIAALPMPTIAAIEGYALGGGLELALACDLRVAASSAKMGLIETTRGLFPGAGGTQRLPRCIGISLAKELIFTGRQIDGQEAFSIGLVNHTVPQNEEGDAAYQRALNLAKEIVPRVSVYSSLLYENKPKHCFYCSLKSTAELRYLHQTCVSKEYAKELADPGKLMRDIRESPITLLIKLFSVDMSYSLPTPQHNRAPIAVRMGKVAINKGTEVDIASGMAIERMCYAQNIPTKDRQEGMAAFIEKRQPKFTGK